MKKILHGILGIVRFKSMNLNASLKGWPYHLSTSYRGKLKYKQAKQSSYYLYESLSQLGMEAKTLNVGTISQN